MEAYQEQLITLDELRTRTPPLRKRQTTLRAQLDSLDAELHDAETYLQLADTLESFLGRLADGLDQLDTAGHQRILRLVVREVLIGGDDDTITVRHTIPTPTGPDDPSYLLRGSSQNPALRHAAERGVPRPVLQVPGLQHLTDQPDQPGVVDLLAQHLKHDRESSRSKHWQMSPSINQVVPVQATATSRKAVWQPQPGSIRAAMLTVGIPRPGRQRSPLQIRQIPRDRGVDVADRRPVLVSRRGFPSL